MIRAILFTILLALLCSIGYGQGIVNFGASRATDTGVTKGILKFTAYANSNSNYFLTVNAQGKVVFAVPSGGGGNADSATFFTNYRADTMRSNIYGQLALKGTVTNVSTGFGMLGGPITTTGTVRVDSNYIMTILRGYKIVDSVALLDSTRLADTSLNLRAVFAADLADSMTVARDSVVKRVPYRYANDSVLLGEYPIRAGQFNLDLTPTMPTVVGGMYWDTGNVTVSLPLNADVNLQIGQESLVRARNNTGSTTTNGSVVYISGAQGNNPTAGLANADSTRTSQVIGVATEDIADNGTGFITTIGVVNNVNTSSWTSGDKLYLSTTNGQLTNTPPASPHISVLVGTALNSTNNGRIFVSPAQPVATDTNLLNGTTVPPTQYAVRRYVLNRLADTAAAIRAAIPSVAGYATTAALADSVSGRQKYSDTATWDATRSWVTGQIPSLTGYQLYSDTSTFDATRAWVNGRGFKTDYTTIAQGAGVTVTGTAPTYTISATGATGVQSVTSTGSTAIISGTTIVNVEVDTTHSFTFTGNNTFTRDIVVDSVNIGTGNALSTNVRVGRSAFPSGTTATRITAIGENTANKITTGTDITLVGHNAGANTSVSVNGLVGVGRNNLNFSTGDNNTALGSQCMARAVAWNGIANVGIGANSGNALTSGSSNSWLGAGAANALTSGSSNVLLGVNSGNVITTGGSNVVLGSYTGNAGGLDIRTSSNRMVLSDGAGNIRAYHNATNWLIGTVTDGSTGILQLSGNLGLNTAGNKLNIATGSQASVGTATLVAGTIEVNTTAVTASSIIMLTGVSTGAPPCATCGELSVGTITAGTKFVINSSLATDTRVVQYWIIN